MRMLVLGAGLQGSACAYDLLRHPGVERVTIADLKPERIPAFLKPHVGKRLALVKLDVQDGAALRAAMADHAAVQNAAPYYFNLGSPGQRWTPVSIAPTWAATRRSSSSRRSSTPKRSSGMFRSSRIAASHPGWSTCSRPRGSDASATRSA